MGIQVSSLCKLTRVVKGEDTMSGLYSYIADGIMALGSTLHCTEEVRCLLDIFDFLIPNIA